MAFAGATLSAACQRQPPPVAQSSLGGEAARVAGTPIPVVLVSEVAGASAKSPRQALDDLVSDALLANAARSIGLDRRDEVVWPCTVALARRVVRRGLEQAAAEGPPRDDELQDVKVAHAIVLRSTRVSEERALAVASAIRQAVAGARSVDDFEVRAKGSPQSDAQVVVERLDAFTADGRSASGELDASFVAAAFLLRAPADVSPVVETRFGWHVIFLVERSLPDQGALARRRADLTPAVFDMRARASLESMLRERRQAVPTELLGSADVLMSEVRTP